MIALGGAVWAALMDMDDSDNECHNYLHFEKEPEEYQTDVIFKGNYIPVSTDVPYLWIYYITASQGS